MKLAERLAKLVQREPDAIADDRIGSLAALLDDEVDPVRAWIAGALGCLGGRAASTIPALEAARQRQVKADRKFGSSLSSVGFIDVALRKIRGTLDASTARSMPPRHADPLYVGLDAK